MKKFSLILGLALFAFSRSLASAGTVTIQNEFLRIDYDDKADSFSVTPVSSGGAPIAAAIKDMSLGTYGPGPATCTSIQDAVFGTGQAIQFGDPMGESAEIELFPGIPFGILKTAWVFNGSKEDTGNHVLHVIERVPVATFFPDLNTSAARLVIRGTGGLHDAQEYATQTPTWMESLWDKFMRRSYHQPGGSYEWLTIADPKTGAGIVAGFLSQNRATGVLKPMFDANGLFVQARNEFGQLQVALGEPVGTETFAFGCFSDVRFGLEKYADVVAKTDKIKLPPQPAGYCTWYAEQHGGSSDEKSLDDLSDFIAKNLQPFGMNFVQIDDGWQLGDSHGNGPNKNFTDSNPKGPYPSGMKATADKIKSDDLTPGLWFIPFGGTFDDPWFADKQDLFMKAKDGKPFDTHWGGTCLDMTNPAARDYLKGIVNNIVHNWGFNYLKMDGFCTGLGAKQIYINSDYNDDNWGEAVLHDPSKTYIEAFRSGIQLVRDTAGPGVFLLGCNTAQNMRVYGASFGMIDAMRIGPDNAGTWKDWSDASPLYGSRNYFLNGRVWYNDPDPCYVRTALSLDEARTAASWTSISGQLYTNSDWLPDLPPERLDIIKRTIAPHGKTARPVDFLENDPPRIWQVIDDKGPVRRDVVALFNWSDKEAAIDVPLAKLDLPKADKYAAFDFWGSAFLPDVTDTISATLPPHACKIIALRPITDFPVVLSSSAHVTQGMTDILEEHWDPATHTLSGKSRVIACDPYELRLATSDPNQHWKIFQAGLNDFHSPNGVTIDTSTDKNHRARFTAAQNGIVSWLFVF